MTRASVALGLAMLVTPSAAVYADPGVGIQGPFGTGAEAVWILLPRGRPRDVVVFLHGWKTAPPRPAGQWVAQFRPWLDHLVARGSAVLFPAYQAGGDAEGRARVTALRRGLEEGFRRLGHPGLPVVAAGYSYGATLAVTYAADARAWGLPVPRALDAVFPALPVPGVPLPGLGRGTEVLIQVGDRDSVAGRAGADSIWSRLHLEASPSQRLVVVRSHGTFVADHAAPKQTTAAARRAFWAPLDGLVARAVGR